MWISYPYFLQVETFDGGENNGRRSLKLLKRFLYSADVVHYSDKYKELLTSMFVLQILIEVFCSVNSENM